jgi:hypothetical protein
MMMSNLLMTAFAEVPIDAIEFCLYVHTLCMKLFTVTDVECRQCTN